jgi:hypothetical protein
MGIIMMYTYKCKILLSFLLGIAAMIAPLSAEIIVLDNTSDLTAPISNNLGSISTTNWNEKVFTTGTEYVTIDTVSLALYANGTAGDYTVNFKLYEVSGGNSYVPTGTALATVSDTVTLTTSAAYYTFDSIFSGFALSANTTYGIVVSSTASGTNCSWTNISSVYTGSKGFSYVTGLRTTNGGTSWYSSSFYNAMQVTVVPEPSTYAMGSGLLVLTFAVRRRKRR